MGFSPHNEFMRQIGKRFISQPALTPSAAHLAAAAEHQRTGAALAAVSTTGIAKGVYRFKSHDEMNQATDAALVRAIAANVRAREERTK